MNDPTILETKNGPIQIKIHRADGDYVLIRKRPTLHVCNEVHSEWIGPGNESAMVYVHWHKPQDYSNHISKPWNYYERDNKWSLPSVHLDIDLNNFKLLRHLQKLGCLEVAAWTFSALNFVDATPKIIGFNMRKTMRQFNDDRGF